MFDPPGAGQVLGKFLLLYGCDLMILIKENCSTGRRTLVDCEDVAHGFLLGQIYVGEHIFEKFFRRGFDLRGSENGWETETTHAVNDHGRYYTRKQPRPGRRA